MLPLVEELKVMDGYFEEMKTKDDDVGYTARDALYIRLGLGT